MMIIKITRNGNNNEYLEWLASDDLSTERDNFPKAKRTVIVKLKCKI